MSDYIKRADAIESVKNTILKRFNLADWYEEILNCGVEIEDTIKALPSADAVQEAIPTVVRVTMSDGSQYYLEHERDAIHADAVQGEWQHTITWQPYCSNCEYVFGEDEEFSPFWKYCPMCGARMKGGAE